MDSNDTEDLPSTDLIGDDPVWTPEIERLVFAVAEQMRLDQPGMIAAGPQRNGKTYAIRYLRQKLPEVLGYPVCSLIWTIPQEPVKHTRVFVQERMFQSGCTAVAHRDLAVLRNRLLDHLADLAASARARRLLIVIDEAQFLRDDDYAMLIFLFNELESRKLRPFFLLVGQPELTQMSDMWMSADAQQMVGRFSTRKHEYLGIQLSDLEEVLRGFDEEVNGEGAPAAVRVAPEAYNEGWRVANVAPLMRQAVQHVAKGQNVSEAVRLPMQYLRSCLLSMLYLIIQKKRNPDALTLAEAIDCVVASNFGAVLQFYVRAGAKSGQRMQ